MIRTLIVDDNAPFRDRLKAFLKADQAVEIIGEALDGQEALQKVPILNPDLVLMDIRMARLNGLSATQQLKLAHPGLVVIILSNYDLHEYRVAAETAGASAYVVKKNLDNELLPNIHQFTAETITK